MNRNINKRGLSTIEFLFVIIIIFMLVGLIMVFMAAAVKEANDAERRSHIAQLMRILLTLKVYSGTFPVEIHECRIGKDCQVFDKILEEKILDIPVDPRGEDYYYRYVSDGENFILKAILADGSEYVYNTQGK